MGPVCFIVVSFITHNQKHSNNLGYRYFIIPYISVNKQNNVEYGMQTICKNNNQYLNYINLVKFIHKQGNYKKQTQIFPMSITEIRQNDYDTFVNNWNGNITNKMEVK
jgi:hypothetical protein